MAERARIHVAFGESAAGSLRLALRTLGLDEDVLSPFDERALGPIDPGDFLQRMQWWSDELGYDDDPEWVALSIEDVRRLQTHTGVIVAWLSRRCASEVCGLHELLWRVEDVPVHVVDVAEVEFMQLDGTSNLDMAKRFAHVPDRQIVELNLLARATPISDIERQRCRADWQRLRTENAAVRILTDSGLVSAPVDTFDETIRSCVTTDWQRCARVIGDTVWKLTDGTYHQCSSDVFLYERLLIMIDAGILEGRTDDDWSMRGSDVRRA